MHQTFPPIAPLREQPFAEAPTPSDSQMRCVGGGSVGGKGTGLRLLEQILRTCTDLHTLEGTTVRLPRTIVLVTHQLEEALLLGQKIVVMHPDSTICEFDLTDLPYPRDPDSPRLRQLKEQITAQCRMATAN